MRNYYLIRVNFRGGIASPGELKSILTIAERCHVFEVRFGLRQQLLLHLPHGLLKLFEKEAKSIGLSYQLDGNFYPNIVSSYVAEEVFQKGNWLNEEIYQEILDLFAYEPQLKVNISDSGQSFTPYFSGHLNFVASELPNFWYLTVRLPKTNEAHAYSQLIYSNDIPALCEVLEREIVQYKTSIPKLWKKIPFHIHKIPTTKELELPTFALPYYEGFNRYGNRTWLGIYKRTELFSTEFLLELCDICLDTKIGQIGITPWKSLIIKGIEELDRPRWTRLLSKYNISMRHAANELNWQVEDDSADALALKHDLVKAFDQQDLRTFGLCFGIKTVPQTEVFAAIMVRRRRFKLLGFIPAFYVYDISYTKDFNPNGRTKIYFAEGVAHFNLAEQLRRSVLLYNKQLAENSIVVIDKPLSPNQEISTITAVHQCTTCFTIYDERFGDELNGIEAGIPFSKLPDTYTCSTCGNAKDTFIDINIGSSFIYTEKPKNTVDI
jgi:rubredoxin